MTDPPESPHLKRCGSTVVAGRHMVEDRGPMNRPLALAAVLAAVAVAASACKREKATQPRPGAVKLIVDGKEAGTFDPPATPRPLAELLPRGMAPYAEWKRFEADGSSGRFLELAEPAKSYPDAEIRVYAINGKAAIGLFRPVKEGLPDAIAKIARQPAVSLIDVHEVRVRIADWGGAEDEVELSELSDLTVEVGDRTLTVPAQRLAQIDLVKGPTQQASGWPLAEALMPVVPPGKIASVRIEGWKGMFEVVPAEDLAKKDVWLLLKANKKGEYVYRRWEKGENQAVDEVRGIRSIQVTMKEGETP